MKALLGPLSIRQPPLKVNSDEDVYLKDLSINPDDSNEDTLLYLDCMNQIV